ncbi:aphidicolan-16beta-ol synthase [Apiospora kogelbergensis]|uniref:aphidicolan-16beta-ol synthase n=1 Tax=Apiospora kogelbergensis TaxID=1337665 RepID=UPI00312ED71B
MTPKYTAAVIALIRQAVADFDDKHDADLLTYALIQLSSTCYHAGFPYHDLECVEISKITHVLHQAMQERAVLGSAPGGKANVTGTSMCIQALSYASKPVGIDDMLRQYDEEQYSFNETCHALAAILCQDDASKYKAQILKAVGSLCQSWWDADGEIHGDTTPTHLHMSLLFIQSMTQVLALMDRESPNQLMDPDLKSRLLIAVFQACLRTMLMQGDDGSWGSSAEESAYGVLILCEARRLSMFSTLASPLDLAIKRGVACLEQLYLLAALYRAAAPPTGSIGDGSFDVARVTKGRKHAKLFSMTPLFSDIPEWEIQASMVESVLFQPMLYARRLDIFPRKDMEDDAKYFDIIPFTWTSCSNRQRTFASTSFLYEMMVISFLNYQADEFLESCAGSVPTDTLRQLIDSAFRPGVDAAHSDVPSYSQIVEPLNKFVTYISTHPCVLAASAWDRASVMRELRIFLHAHVTQLVDNVDFQKNQQTAASRNGCVTEYDANQQTFSAGSVPRRPTTPPAPIPSPL